MDKGFRPKLYTHVNDESRKVLDAWQIVKAGTPILGHNEYRTALWRGGRYNHRGETVSLVIAVPEECRFPDHAARSAFYFGVVTREAVEMAESPMDAFIDAATARWWPTGADSPLENFIATVNQYVPAPPLQ